MSQIITFLEDRQHNFLEQLKQLSIVHTSWHGVKRYSIPNQKGSVSFQQLVSIAKRRFNNQPLTTRLQVMEHLWVKYQATDSVSNWKIIRLFQWILSNTTIPFCIWIRNKFDSSNPIAMVAQLVQQEMNVQGAVIPMLELSPKIQDFLIEKGLGQMWFDIPMLKDANKDLAEKLNRVNILLLEVEKIRRKVGCISNPVIQQEVMSLEQRVLASKQALANQMSRQQDILAEFWTNTDYKQLNDAMDDFIRSLEMLNAKLVSCDRTFSKS